MSPDALEASTSREGARAGCLGTRVSLPSSALLPPLSAMGRASAARSGLRVPRPERRAVPARGRLCPRSPAAWSPASGRTPAPDLRADPGSYLCAPAPSAVPAPEREVGTPGRPGPACAARGFPGRRPGPAPASCAPPPRPGRRAPRPGHCPPPPSAWASYLPRGRPSSGPAACWRPRGGPRPRPPANPQGFLSATVKSQPPRWAQAGAPPPPPPFPPRPPPSVEGQVPFGLGLVNFSPPLSNNPMFATYQLPVHSFNYSHSTNTLSSYYVLGSRRMQLVKQPFINS